MRRILIALAVVIFLGLMGLAVFGQRGLLNLHKLRSDRMKLEQDAGHLEKENGSLRKKVELLADDLKYLEKLARQKLGMVRRDEVIIKVPEAGSALNQPGPEQAKDSPKKEKGK